MTRLGQCWKAMVSFFMCAEILWPRKRLTGRGKARRRLTQLRQSLMLKEQSLKLKRRHSRLQWQATCTLTTTKCSPSKSPQLNCCFCFESWNELTNNGVCRGDLNALTDALENAIRDRKIIHVDYFSADHWIDTALMQIIIDRLNVRSRNDPKFIMVGKFLISEQDLMASRSKLFQHLNASTS